MKVQQVVRRFAVVGASTSLVAVAVTATTTTPAAASMVGAGAVYSTTLSIAHNVSATLSYDATPTLGGSYVAWNCKVAANPDPASTGLTTCSVGGNEAIGSPGNAPGAAYAAAGVTFVPNGSVPSACVQGHATFIESIIGPANVSTPLRCQRLNVVVVADAA